MASRKSDGSAIWNMEKCPGRILKKAILEGRSERRAKAYPLEHVEALNDARTTHGNRRVSARRGWVGEKSDFPSILFSLFGGTSAHPYHNHETFRLLNTVPEESPSGVQRSIPLQ